MKAVTGNGRMGVKQQQLLQLPAGRLRLSHPAPRNFQRILKDLK
jgi:hypothetical protein